MMLKKSKFVNILCSMIFGVILCAVILLLLLLTSSPVLTKTTDLVFRTDSDEKIYDGQPLQDLGWMLSGDLVSGHEAIVSFTVSRTNVGESENTATIRIVDANGEDVTDQYRIRCEYGTLRILPRLLTVTSASAFREYDEEDQTPLTAPDFELGEALVAGHRATVEVTGSLSEIGMIPNTVASVVILDGEGNDVTSNYNLVVREGLLAITEQQNENPPSTDIDDPNGSSDLLPSEGMENVVIYSVYGSVDGPLYLKVRSYGDYTGKGWKNAPVYTELFDHTYSPAYMTAAALKQAERRAQTVRIKSFCKDYGLPYYFTLENPEIQTNETFFQGNTDGVYDVDYYELGSEIGSLSFPDSDYERAYREFVYSNYLQIDGETLAYMIDLIAREGFSADKASVIADVATYIQGAAVYDMEYPRELEEQDNVVIAFLETYKTGVCRHYASAAVLLYRALGIPARYTVGALAEMKAGEWTDVTRRSAHAWVEVYLDGIGWVQVEVTGGTPESDELTLTPVTSRFEYDGINHESHDLVTGFEKFESLGYTYEVKVSGARRTPGKTVTEIEELRIFDPQGNDVTAEFAIKKNTGLLQVYRQKFVFKSRDESFTYGSPLGAPAVDTDPAVGSAGLTAVVTRNLTSENVGLLVNKFSVKLMSAKGEDVTDEYWISSEYGQLRIHARRLTLKAGDAEKAYDGTELTCDTYEIMENTLLRDHKIAFCEIEGSQKSVGRSENEIVHVTIHDADGNNVTQNYAIVLLPGRLKVKPS